MTDMETDRGRLRGLAKKAGLAGETRTAIAARLGVHVTTVGRWAKADGWRLRDLRAAKDLAALKQLPLFDEAVALHHETPALVAEQLKRRALWLEVVAAEATRQGRLREGAVLLGQGRRYRALHRFYKAQCDGPHQVPPDPRRVAEPTSALMQEGWAWYARAVRDEDWRREQGWPVTEKEKQAWWKANAHLYGETAPEWWDDEEEDDA